MILPNCTPGVNTGVNDVHTYDTFPGDNHPTTYDRHDSKAKQYHFVTSLACSDATDEQKIRQVSDITNSIWNYNSYKKSYRKQRPAPSIPLNSPPEYTDDVPDMALDAPDFLPDVAQELPPEYADDCEYSPVDFAEYEQWITECEGSKVEEIENLALGGVASNEHHPANPTTCKEGCEMYENNSSTPSDGVPPTPRVIKINQQYLADSIAVACKEWRFLQVKSDKGTGKTTAMKAILNELDLSACVLFVTPRKKLNYTLAHDLRLNYYEDVKNERDRAVRKELAKRMVITPQSLGAIIAEFPDIKYQFIVLDESEAVASMLVSKVTKSKVKTLKALKTVAANAGNTVLMDAALGVRSRKLMDILGGDADVGTLVNEYQRWSNINADILEGGRYADRVKIADAQQIEVIQRGEKIAISSGSAEYCELRFKVLSALFPGLKIGLFTSGTSIEVARILANPALAGEYDVLIFSPAVSIGVSFDIQNHFDRVFGVYPNIANKTGDSDDAIQGLARIRHPAKNHWVVVLDDDKNVFKNADVISLPEDIKKIVLDRYKRESFFSGCPADVLAEDDYIADLFSVCKSYYIDNKNNFNERFRQSLIESGVQIRNVDISLLEVNQDSIELTDGAKAEKKEKVQKDKTESQKIDKNTHDRLKFDQRLGVELSPEQTASMARFKFEDRFNIDCDTADKETVDKCLELDGADIISKCINREVALSGDDFTKQYVKARIKGIDDTGAFKVDVIDDKLGYRLKKKLLDYAVPYFDGAEYSHESLVKSRLWYFVYRHQKEIILSEVIPLPKDWEKKPALIMNHLLGMCGYGHKRVCRGAKGKKRKAYVAVPNESADDICNMRTETGKDWITQTLRIMGLYQEIVKSPEAKTRVEKLWDKVGRTDDIEAFLSEFADDLEYIESGNVPDEKMLDIIKYWRAA